MAGCFFKNPPNIKAWQLIDEVRFLSNDAVGISEIHANFLINKGNAKSQDFLNLIHKIKEEIRRKYDIELEQEVEFIE
jgi:UDP-N-acetylmuramate dehydrogenase